MRDVDLQHFSAFLKEFQGESDRGAALISAALIDERLATILRAFMTSGTSAGRLLDGPYAPLSTFSARASCAHALGLVGHHEFAEITLIRKIRNEFAHRSLGASFILREISSLCHKLQSDLPGGPAGFADDPRGKFINASILIVMGLTYRAEYVAREKRTHERWP